MTGAADTGKPGVSKTAIHVAIGRAIGAREPDSTVRNPDYLVERLLGGMPSESTAASLTRVLDLDYEEAMKSFEVARNVCAMIVRTRFVDEILLRAVAEGATQLVIFGAGLDTRAFRFSESLEHVRVFEVDRFASQSFKRQRVNARLGEPPRNLRYVPIDLDKHKEMIDIERYGFDVNQRSLFILEGVTVYLQEDSVDSILRFVRRCAHGSRIVLDFVAKELIDAFARMSGTATLLAERPQLDKFFELIEDEPWTFGVPLRTERDYLRAYGIEIQQSLELGGGDAARKYLTRTDGTLVGEYSARRSSEPVEEGRRNPRISSRRLQTRNRMLSPCLIEGLVR